MTGMGEKQTLQVQDYPLTTTAFVATPGIWNERA